MSVVRRYARVAVGVLVMALLSVPAPGMAVDEACTPDAQGNTTCPVPVKGTVADASTGQPLAGVTVSVRSSVAPYAQSGNASTTDANGNYSVLVDASGPSFILKFEAAGYLDNWYDEKEQPQDATVLQGGGPHPPDACLCLGTTQLMVPYITVSGSIKEWGSESALGSSVHATMQAYYDEGTDYNTSSRFAVAADANGNYSIKLPKTRVFFNNAPDHWFGVKVLRYKLRYTADTHKDVWWQNSDSLATAVVVDPQTDQTDHSGLTVWLKTGIPWLYVQDPGWTVCQLGNGPLATATDGTPPYTWSLDSPIPGMDFDTTYGMLSGTPASTAAYDRTVTVTDAANKTRSVPVHFQPAPSAVTVQHPSRDISLTVGQATTIANAASCGAGGPYTWTPRSALPPGLSFNPSSGSISGTPTAAGDWDFSATVTDASNMPATAATKLHVAAAATMVPPVATVTGQRAAALAKCKKKPTAAKRRHCRKRAMLLPI